MLPAAQQQRLEAKPSLAFSCALGSHASGAVNEHETQCLS
jgi:hypothetical protein